MLAFLVFFFFFLRWTLFRQLDAYLMGGGNAPATDISLTRLKYVNDWHDGELRTFDGCLDSMMARDGRGFFGFPSGSGLNQFFYISPVYLVYTALSGRWFHFWGLMAKEACFVCVIWFGR